MHVHLLNLNNFFFNKLINFLRLHVKSQTLTSYAKLVKGGFSLIGAAQLIALLFYSFKGIPNMVSLIKLHRMERMSKNIKKNIYSKSK